jgi:hypothetical protein
MFRLRHPFSGHIYGALDDGLVQVEKDGIFDRYGTWLRGEILSADAEMCRWVGTEHSAPPTRHRAGFGNGDHGEIRTQTPPTVSKEEL